MLRGSRKLPLAIVVLLAAGLLALPSAVGAAVSVHGRAWELVTSGDTNGAPLLGVRGWGADGDRIAFAALGALPGAPAGDLIAHATATRTSQGWRVAPVGNVFTASRPTLEYPMVLAVSSDVSSWLWLSPIPLLPGAPTDPTLGLYRQRPDGTLMLLGSGGGRFDGFAFMGASGDLAHAAFQTQAHLLPADAERTQGSAAYEFADSTLRLVGVDDTGAPLSPCGSVIGNGIADPSRTLNAVSRDGRRIFFSASPTCSEPSRVYVREDGAHTTDVSTSRCTRADCNGPQEVTFVGATRDGSQAFLVTGQQLTDDDVDGGLDLYRRSVSGGSLTRLSAGAPGAVADVSQFIVQAADDGERVYFVATGVLVPGEGAAGRPNVYLSDHGTLRFVVTLDDIDLSKAEITADGGALVFTAPSALLPSDLDSSTDVYRYDAASDALTHVSLGASDRGNEPFDASFEATGRFALPTLSNQRVRHLSDDGRVFFATSEALLPEDHNQTVDVYERANGALGLVTSGVGKLLAYAGASPDGRSVFFTTEESLVAADLDRGNDDLYVARLGGGFPEPVPPPTPCTGDACQGPPSGRLDRPSPDSLTNARVGPQSAPFGLRQLRAQARRRLAATGRALLLLEVPAAGHVSLVARARTARRPRAGGLTVVGRVEVTVSRAGVVRLPLRLSRAAVRTLKAQGSLLLTLSVRHSTLGAAPSTRIRLSKVSSRRHRGGSR